MRGLLSSFSSGAALLACFALAVAQTPVTPAPPAPQKQLGAWWTERATGVPAYRANATKLPLISVKGNRFVDPQGSPILFRGLSISDPDKMERQGYWSRDHFVKVKEMGAMVVRIPVHPVAWRGRMPAEYIKLLDQAVEWCTDLGMYVMLDW